MGHLVLSSTAGLGVSIIGSFLGCALFHECAECFFLIGKENFIQRHNNESPKYIGSIQQGTKIIKNINDKHPSNHRPKK